MGDNATFNEVDIDATVNENGVVEEIKKEGFVKSHWNKMSPGKKRVVKILGVGSAIFLGGMLIKKLTSHDPEETIEEIVEDAKDGIEDAVEEAGETLVTF